MSPAASIRSSLARSTFSLSTKPASTSWRLQDALLSPSPFGLPGQRAHILLHSAANPSISTFVCLTSSAALTTSATSPCRRITSFGAEKTLREAKFPDPSLQTLQALFLAFATCSDHLSNSEAGALVSIVDSMRATSAASLRPTRRDRAMLQPLPDYALPPVLL